MRQSLASSVLHLKVIESEVRLRVGDPEVREALAGAWSRCLTPGHTGVGEDPLEIEVGNGASTRWLTTELTRHAITDLTGKRLMLHSAGVADQEGRVIALVGPSGAGKSTAAADLARSEFGYVTDETLVVRRPDAVVAFPRPLRLRGCGNGEEIERGPDELGLGHCPDGLRLARIAVLERDPHHEGGPVLSSMGAVDGILTLTEQISSLGELEDPLRWLCELIEQCGVFRLSYADVAAVAGLLPQLLEDRTKRPEPWQHVPAIGQPGDPDAVGGTLVQSRYTDAVIVGDEAVVLLRDQPVRLIGIGLTIWQAAHEPTTFAEILERVLTEYGEHPEAEQRVAAAVGHLLRAGVVHLGGGLALEDFVAASRVVSAAPAEPALGQPGT